MTKSEQIVVEAIIRNLENIKHKSGLITSHDIEAIKDNLCDLYGVAGIVLCTSRLCATYSETEHNFIAKLATDFIKKHQQP